MATEKELEALIKLNGKIDPSLRSSMNQAANMTEKTGGKLSKLGGLAAKAGQLIVAGAVAGTVALTSLALKAGDTGDYFMKMKDKTGMAFEDLQKLKYAADQLGANFDTVPGAIGKTNKAMASAMKGSKEAKNAFKSLGVEIKDAATGKMRPASDVFQESVVQLSKMKNVSERNALAYQLFGKSAADLFPILNAGEGEMKRLGKEASNLGLVISDDGIKALDDFGDSMDKIKAAAKSTAFGAVASLLPKIQPYIDRFAEKIPLIAPEIAKFADEGANLGGAVLPQLMQVGAEIMPVIAGLAPVITNIAQTVLPPLVTMFSSILSVVMPLLPLIGKLAQVISVSLVLAFKVLTPIIQGVAWLVEGALKAVELLINKYKELTNGNGQISVETYTKEDKKNPFRQKALGGFVDSPVQAGEAGPESIIPLRRTPRSLNLLKKTERALGVASGSSSNGGIVVNYNPVIYAQNAAGVEQVLKNDKVMLFDKLQSIVGDQRRVEFGTA